MDVGAGQPDATVVDGQHRLMSPAQGGGPDRIGSLFATVLARLPQRRIPGGPNAYHEPVDVTSAQRILTLW